MIAAARLPARRLPANSQFDLPIAIGRMWFRSFDFGLEQHHFARLIDAMYGKTFLARSTPTATILMDFPFRANSDGMHTLPILAL